MTNFSRNRKSYCVTVSAIVCDTEMVPEVAVMTTLLAPEGVPGYLSLLLLQPLIVAINTTANTTRVSDFHAGELRRRRKNRNSKLAELMPDAVMKPPDVWIEAWKDLFFGVVAITATTVAV